MLFPATLGILCILLGLFAVWELKSFDQDSIRFVPFPVFENGTLLSHKPESSRQCEIMDINLSFYRHIIVCRPTYPYDGKGPIMLRASREEMAEAFKQWYRELKREILNEAVRGQNATQKPVNDAPGHSSRVTLETKSSPSHASLLPPLSSILVSAPLLPTESTDTTAKPATTTPQQHTPPHETASPQSTRPKGPHDPFDTPLLNYVMTILAYAAALLFVTFLVCLLFAFAALLVYLVRNFWSTFISG